MGFDDVDVGLHNKGVLSVFIFQGQEHLLFPGVYYQTILSNLQFISEIIYFLGKSLG